VSGPQRIGSDGGGRGYLKNSEMFPLGGGSPILHNTPGKHDCKAQGGKLGTYVTIGKGEETQLVGGGGVKGGGLCEVCPITGASDLQGNPDISREGNRCHKYLGGGCWMDEMKKKKKLC